MRSHHLTQATPILDHHAPAIRQLIQQRNWTSLGLHDRVGAAYAYVRDEIAFGYNTQDDLPASRVLADGIGQCNTKGTLLMALLRAMDVPCRFHGFTIDKALQKGAITGLAYLLAPGGSDLDRRGQPKTNYFVTTFIAALQAPRCHLILMLLIVCRPIVI